MSLLRPAFKETIATKLYALDFGGVLEVGGIHSFERFSITYFNLVVANDMSVYKNVFYALHLLQSTIRDGNLSYGSSWLGNRMPYHIYIISFCSSNALVLLSKCKRRFCTTRLSKED